RSASAGSRASAWWWSCWWCSTPESCRRSCGRCWRSARTWRATWRPGSEGRSRVAARQVIVSGARPTGRLHLGNWHGALKNWVRLQHEHECLFFVADWHALTTAWEDPQGIQDATIDMVLDWLAVGLDPSHCTIFQQSAVM